MFLDVSRNNKFSSLSTYSSACFFFFSMTDEITAVKEVRQRGLLGQFSGGSKEYEAAGDLL